MPGLLKSDHNQHSAAKHIADDGLDWLDGKEGELKWQTKSAQMKSPSPLKELQKVGQSIWLDYIRRSLITKRRTQTIGRGGRSARGDQQPGDLREGD